LPRAARAEIDALAEAHLAAGGTQPPYRAARQPQPRPGPILDQRGLDRRVQMEAHRERVARAARQLVLAAQIVAVAGEIKLARIAQPISLPVAIVVRGDPLVAGFLGPLATHHGGSAAERAV